MRTFFCLFILFFLSSSKTTFGQSSVLEYPQIAEKFRQHYNTGQTDSVFAMLSLNTQRVLPLERIRVVLGQLKAQFGNLDSTRLITQKDSVASFKANFATGQLLLTFSLNQKLKIGILTFTPYYEPAKMLSNSKLDETDIQIQHQGHTLKGTMTMPKSAKNQQVILIVAGSGPTDRNGNQAGANNNSLKMLSDALAENGIASVRYDKRGVGESKAPALSANDLQFNIYLQDAIAFTRHLMKDERFAQVILLGHSEGALLTILAAGELSPAGLISLNGQAEPAKALLERQLKGNLPDSLYKIASNILGKLQKGTKVTDIVDPSLRSFFNPSLQNYLISWMQFDPLDEIKKVSVPITIIQGSEDLQTGELQARTLSLVKPTSKLIVIKGMNHVLKTANGDKNANLRTYDDPVAPLHPDLAKVIIEFAKSLKF